MKSKHLRWWRPSSWLAPKYCIASLDKLIPYLLLLSLCIMGYGFYGALWDSPPDYQQGESVRIIYIHVPAAFWSMALYLGMAFFSLLYWVFHIKVADAFAKACCVPGIIMTALALMTGSLWGKPMWGTYWVWDARLSSELLLLFLFFGVYLLRQSFASNQSGARAAAILAMVGSVDLPIIHFSVQWWNSLHQGSTISKFAKPSMDTQMLIPLLLMLLGSGLYVLCIVCMGASRQLKLSEKEAYRRSQWERAHGTL